MADSAASSSGTHPPRQPTPATGGVHIQVEAPAQEDADPKAPPTLSEATTAFIGSPLLPEPEQLIMGHISSLMALITRGDGPICVKFVQLLSMEYDFPTATLIWETWAPYIAPPVGHPLAGHDLAKDLVLATLCKPFPRLSWPGRRPEP